MENNVEIILIENSITSNDAKKFTAQNVEIAHEDNTTKISTDGIISEGRHPYTVTWFGGKQEYFKNVESVKINDAYGDSLIDGELNTFYGGPSDFDGGVKFFVL